MEWIMFVLLVVLLSFFWYGQHSQLRVHHDGINTRLDALSTRLSAVEEHLTRVEALLEWMMGSSRSHRFVHAAGLACALVVAGCGPRIAFVATHEQSYDSWDGTVRILHEMPSDDAYIELGVLVGQGRGSQDWGEMLRALQKEGQEKGANAIVLICKKTSKNAAVSGSGIVGFSGSTHEEKAMMVLAIRILY